MPSRSARSPPGAAYVALFTLLSVVSRNAVLFGLIYALIWEGVVGGYVAWSEGPFDPTVGLSISESMSALQQEQSVSTPRWKLGTAVVLLSVVTVGSIWFAGHRPRSLRMRSSD